MITIERSLCILIQRAVYSQKKKKTRWRTTEKTDKKEK